MALNNINLGTAANNGTGEDIRSGGGKINANFAFLDSNKTDKGNYAGTAGDLKTYVDTMLQGLKWKDSVLVATTANIALTGEQTIDGVLTATSRVLVKEQTTKTENGIYLTGAGAWTRTTDADANTELTSATVSIEQGTTLAGDIFTCNTSPITLGTTDIEFVSVSRGTVVTDHNALSGKQGGAPGEYNHLTNAELAKLQAAPATSEAAFTKNSAFNKNFGTVADTVAQGDDSRIINGQAAFDGLASKETPAGAQAKADAKVEDLITDGVLDKAPSQNAVFDALALKQDKGTTSSTAITSFLPNWQSGLTFIPYATFTNNGTALSDSRSITLTASDPTLDRFDLFAINLTTNQIEVIQGTPANPAVEPSYDPLTHLAANFVSIKAAATTPENVVGTAIWTEGAEWATTGASANFDFANTESPNSGTYAIKTINPLAANEPLPLIAPSPVAVVEGMEIQYKIKNIVGGAHRFLITGNKTNNKTANVWVNAPAKFDAANTTTYQSLAVLIPTGTLAEITRISFINSVAGVQYFLDDVRLVTGGGAVDNGGVTKQYVDDQDAATLAAAKAYSDNTVQSVTGSAVDNTDPNNPIVNIPAGGSVTESIGATIDLSNPLGTYYNMSAANSATSYAYVNEIVGGKAIILINATSEPTVTGATKTNNYVFVANESIYLTVWYNGNRVEYYFTEITKETFIDITALPYGAAVTTSTNPATIFTGSPSIIKTTSGRLLVAHDYFGSGTTQNLSTVFYSDDAGQSWIKAQDISLMFWGTLFEYSGSVYLIGTSGSGNGSIVISKSTDDGLTWGASITLINSLEGGFATASCSFIIKDGYFVKSFEIQSTGAWAGWHKEVLAFGLLTDLTNPASWSLSNQVTFNKATYPLSIGTNGTDAKRPVSAATASKGWLEGNVIEKTNGDIIILLRLEQSPNSNNAIYLDVAWNSGTPVSSTINATHNYIEMPGGNIKTTIRYDATSGLYWTVSNVNKYKWFNDNRIEAYLMSASEPNGVWTVKEKVLGYTPTVAWQAEIEQYGVQYSDFIIDGTDILCAVRVADANADNNHNSNIISIKKIENFRSSVAETYVEGSLIIDENSERLEDANGIAIIKDQSKYYNSPFMLDADNAKKPNWVTNGIQFDSASYLRLIHNKYLNIDNGFSVFVVVENLQSTTGKRILSKSMGSPASSDVNPRDYTFSDEGMTVGLCYAGYTDKTIGQNYIFAASYDSVNNHIYNYKNGVNRGNPNSLTGGTWNTDHITKTATYELGNTAELWVGARRVGSLLAFDSKIKALHIIPSYMTPAQMVSYQNDLNTIYSIY